MLLKSSGYYLLRLPALPLNRNSDQPDARNRLQQLWEETHFPEAIFVASPALYEQIYNHLVLAGWPLPEAQTRTMLRYALRMSSRATPFGVMAGFSVGQLTTKSQVEIAPQHSFIRHHRLDMDYLASLVRYLTREPAIRKQLRFFSNNSRYIAGSELRYTERDDSESIRHYFLSALTATAYLTEVLERAESGATPGQLATSLTETGVDLNQATLFVEQLIDNQLLISELDPILTGPPMLDSLRTKLNQLSGTDLISQALTATKAALRQPFTDSRSVQQTVHEALTYHLPDVPRSHLIQTDLQINTTTNQVSERVIHTILEQLERLKPLNQPRPNAHLTDFVRRFQERYDQQEVPLQLVLDGDLGIGYGDTAGGQANYAPLLATLGLPKTGQAVSATWGPCENLLMAKLSQALRTGQQAVELTDADLVPLKATQLPVLPASFHLFGNLLASSADALDAGNFGFNVLAVGGPSAATLVGRFCAYSTELTTAVQASLYREEQQQPDCIYAEIVHWPDDRLGNILVRPALRAYEIPYISRASVDEDHQLPLSDLLVSVQPGGRVFLRSKRYDREVIPRLSTAHNYRSGLSTYQFLADLQYQDGYMNLGWDWKVLADQPFLPRITYQNLILNRARWRLEKPTLPVGSADALIKLLTAAHQLPRWVAIAEGDNELVLDLERNADKQVLLDEVRRHPVVRLVEWVATPDQCWIQHDQSVFVNEIVIPCEISTVSNPPLERVVNPERVPTLAEADRCVPGIRRSFGPGSDWLYLKLYSGEQTADDLLKALIGPFIEEVIAQNSIQACFYVRYADPDPHLRLRLQSATPQVYGGVLDRLNKELAPFQQAGLVYKVQTDTYEREIERYGPATMVDSEQVFTGDSRAILRYLAQETDPTDRWHFALQSCNALLTDFSLDSRQKVHLLQQIQAQFLTEHGATKVLRQQLNDRFRIERDLIDTLLGPTDQPETQPAGLILAERSLTLRPTIARIRAQTEIVSSAPSSRSLLASYLHMSLNRLFASQQRTHELVVYHFLARYYESRLARQQSR